MTELTKTILRFGGETGAGTHITYGWPGDGYASYPWALDHYERNLGISISESWLLKKLIKYSWNFGDRVYPSLRKMTRDSIVSSATLNENIKSLRRKGFVRRISFGEGMDRRIRYDIGGLMIALAYAIASDKKSFLNKEQSLNYDLRSLGKNVSLEKFLADFPNVEILTISDVNNLLNSNGKFIEWGVDKIYQIPDDMKSKKKENNIFN
jgi:hypothetical protein